MRTHRSKSTDRPHRSGFTLLELLAVITIISILLALILPVLSGVIGRGDEVAVSAEITQLEQALASFKAKYGEYPPSSLVIPVGSGGWTARDRSIINQFWPQFNFATCGGLTRPDGTVGYPPGTIHLSGAECLVFFLGGIDGDPADATYTPAGFSNNPISPWMSAGFSGSASPMPPVSTNRVGPFFQFEDASRLETTPDGGVVYLDPMPGQSRPYMYLSGAGRNLPKVNNPAGNPDSFDLNGDSTDLQRAYVKADGKTAYKEDSFQLISPGEDGLYGEGGVWADDFTIPEARREERDNITNFSGGPLN